MRLPDLKHTCKAKQELIQRLAMQAVEPEVDLVSIDEFEGRGQVPLKFGAGSHGGRIQSHDADCLGGTRN